MGEPKITVNGVALTEAQSMTVRVALESFAMMLTSDSLGDDEHGRFMTKAYLENLDAIRKSLYAKAS